MIYGIGLDIVELKRIERLLNKNTRFEERVFTPKERDRLKAYQGQRRLEFAGGRYAAKEAFAKAAGTGISREFGFQDIEVDSDKSGKPFIKQEGTKMKIHVSITHSEEYAAAQVILES
ncbi:holo-ACP synthase [Alteribacillus sp. YIM 98480]|uniref:holo-ACP synthase n=1 Tax=Alteribacillus sp. YIM 98480 TaxID=2606599 RepID=UPI00131D5768|nr:holo-ACP synthase [Alteribacillus sp. YIM 98480]